MADFSASEEMGVRSPYQASQPVVDQSPAIGLDILSKVASVGGSLAASDAAQKGQGVLNSFTQQQLKYAKAVDQGKMTPQQARMNMRKDFSQTLSNNPSLYDDLKSRQDDVISKSGLGKVIEEGTEIDQSYRKLQDGAIQDGFANRNMNPRQMEEAVDQYSNFTKAGKELQRVAAQKSALAADVSLSAQQLSLKNSQLAQQSQQATFNFVTSYQPKFSNDMMTLVEGFDTGEIGSREDAIRAIEGEWNKVMSTVSQVGHRAGSEYLSNLAFGMRKTYEDTLSYINGDITKKSLEAENSISIQMATQNWLSQPDMAELAAASRLWPNSDFIRMRVNDNPQVLDFLSSNSTDDDEDIANPLAGGDRAKKVFSQYIDGVITPNINRDSRGSLDEEGKAQLDNNIINLFKGVDSFSSSTRNPQQYQKTIDFVASDAFKKWSDSRGGVPEELSVPFTQAIQSNYIDVVMPLVKSEWEGGTVRSSGAGSMVSPSKTFKTSEVVKPEFRGGGVTFVPVSNIGTLDRNSVSSKAKSLNKEVAPILNKLIRMTGNVSGESYKKVYEDYYASLFGEESGTAEE